MVEAVWPTSTNAPPMEGQTDSKITPSNQECLRVLGVTQTKWEHINTSAIKKRKLIHEGKEVSDWSKVKSWKGFYSKISAKLKAKNDTWVRWHPHVIDSPIARDSLLVQDLETGYFIRKSNILL